MADRLHWATDETLQRIAAALERSSIVSQLVWDSANGRYTDQSVAAMLEARRDGLAYGVSIPKGSATACTKTGANAGIAAPTPGYVGSPAIDPYTNLGPFFHIDCNGTVDADGTPHVTAIEGDGRFKRDGSNGNVWVLAPVLWWLMEDGTDAVSLSISDTQLAGLSLQPQAKLPDGAQRAFMLYAKYVGSNDGSDKMASVSGAKPWNRSVSHNNLITQTATASTGYSGKSIADDWYVKVMFMVKYATKNSQSVLCGCSGYNFQYSPAVAETGTTRVILTNDQAANLLVGSAMMLGSHTGASSNDRNTAVNFDIFDGVRIASITDYDADHKAVNMNTAQTFDTATTQLFSTSPWWTGVLDDVEGDGARSAAGRTNGMEPCKIQGIETMMGLLECLGDVIVNGDAELGWEPCVNYDSRNEATSVTADYVHSGKYMVAGSSTAYHYPLYPYNAGGLLMGQGDGASQSTGMCDAQYTSALGTGTKEWLGLGSLNSAGIAGLWYVSGSYALTHTHWYFGSRLSGTGRGRA